MSWLARLAGTPDRGRLQFAKDAPGIQVRDAKLEVIDTRRIAQLADAVSSLREQLSGSRKTQSSELP
jgi:hypothetical protein